MDHDWHRHCGRLRRLVARRVSRVRRSAAGDSIRFLRHRQARPPDLVVRSPAPHWRASTGAGLPSRCAGGSRCLRPAGPCGGHHWFSGVHRRASAPRCVGRSRKPSARAALQWATDRPRYPTALGDRGPLTRSGRCIADRQRAAARIRWSRSDRKLSSSRRGSQRPGSSRDQDRRHPGWTRQPRGGRGESCQAPGSNALGVGRGGKPLALWLVRISTRRPVRDHRGDCAARDDDPGRTGRSPASGGRKWSR